MSLALEAIALLLAKAPSGARWPFEIMHDGYRAQAHIAGDNVRIVTKSGFDWAARMPAIAEALRTLPAVDAVMEGPDSVTDFFSHQAALASDRVPGEEHSGDKTSQT